VSLAAFIQLATLSSQHFNHLCPSGSRHSLFHFRPIVSAGDFFGGVDVVPHPGPPPAPAAGPLPELPPPAAPEPPPDDDSVKGAGQHVPPISIQPGAQLWTGISSPGNRPKRGRTDSGGRDSLIDARRPTPFEAFSAATF
jgi:hypothetical protein